jgi:hypothetical protein
MARGSNSRDGRVARSEVSSGRSDKAAFRLAIKSLNEGEANRYRKANLYGEKLNKMTERDLRFSVGDYISNNLERLITDSKGNKIDLDEEQKVLGPQAEARHEEEAKRYAKESPGRSESDAYETVDGNSDKRVGFAEIGGKKFTFNYYFTSSVFDQDEEDRGRRSWQSTGKKIDYDSIKQA